ncbi:FMN-binding negative transcriptional regulator [Cupriavidus basilensis]
MAERDGQTWRIEGHVARANPHWRWLEQSPQVLLVFQGPHGRVSPSLYEQKLSVPTPELTPRGARLCGGQHRA